MVVAGVGMLSGMSGVGGAIVAGAINGAIVGAIVGAVGAAISGGDILSGMGKGALMGAATGAVMGGIGEAFSQASTATAPGGGGAGNLSQTQTMQLPAQPNVPVNTSGVIPATVEAPSAIAEVSTTQASNQLTGTAAETAKANAAVETTKGFWSGVDLGEVAVKAGGEMFGAYGDIEAAKIAAEASAVEKIGIAGDTQYAGATVVQPTESAVASTGGAKTTGTSSAVLSKGVL